MRNHMLSASAARLEYESELVQRSSTCLQTSKGSSISSQFLVSNFFAPRCCYPVFVFVCVCVFSFVCVWYRPCIVSGIERVSCLVSTVYRSQPVTVFFFHGTRATSIEKVVEAIDRIESRIKTLSTVLFSLSIETRCTQEQNEMRRIFDETGSSDMVSQTPSLVSVRARNVFVWAVTRA